MSSHRLLRSVRTIHADGEWLNILEDGSLLSRHVEKTEATQVGRHVAQKRHAEHVIYNEDGTVGGRRDYREWPQAADC